MLDFITIADAERIADDETGFVYNALAAAKSHVTLPSRLLEIAKNSNRWLVKMAITQNNNSPAEAIMILVKDKDEYIREAAIKHPNCPIEIKFIRDMEK